MKDIYNSDWINIDGNNIHKTAIIFPNVIIGKGNTIGPFCVIGSNGEMRGVSQKDFKGHVQIGNNNVISEFVSIQRPFEQNKITFIGDNNIIMAHSHVGHDAFIGDDCEICTGTIIGGHAVIGRKSKIKLGVTIRNRIQIGENSLVGLGSVVVKNVNENEIVYGNPARLKY